MSGVTTGFKNTEKCRSGRTKCTFYCRDERLKSTNARAGGENWGPFPIANGCADVYGTSKCRFHVQRGCLRRFVDAFLGVLYIYICVCVRWSLPPSAPPKELRSTSGPSATLLLCDRATQSRAIHNQIKKKSRKSIDRSVDYILNGAGIILRSVRTDVKLEVRRGSRQAPWGRSSNRKWNHPNPQWGVIADIL